MLVATTAALLPLTAATAATAKPTPVKPACYLLTDDKDDVYLLADKQTGKTVPELDVQSVDIASGAKTVVVVLRVASGKFASQQLLTTGATWNVVYSIWGAVVNDTYAMTQGPTGATFTASSSVSRDAGRTSNPLPVTADVTGNVLRWTMPRSALGELAKKRGIFEQMFGQANAGAIGHDYAPNDGHVAKATYVDRSPSCVKAS
jgi:hypothetical protein